METVQFDGLDIILARMTLSEAQRWHSSMSAGIWCGILAEGTIATCRSGLDNTWKPKTAINYSIDTPVTVEHVVPQACQLSAVFIRLPFDRVDAIAGPGARTALAPQKTNYRSWQNHRAASALAWQMLGCPLVGPARRLYLSGKALEVLSVIAQSDAVGTAGTAGSEGIPAARAGEIERIHAARALLLSSLADPPSVPDLARSVGMNAHRLGALFRAVFGASVYSYVKAARLDHAKMLLEAGEMSVSQAAYSCGYHPAHFSTEFRKRFGISPSACIGRNDPYSG
ncbi:AraC family transcriptional regulator [Hyphomicrobium sp.]|uniref:helix-turn-helix transcriptional regulator n=1 Tax=Hyphomicrobium sp. TaxID=82 RepID=UPI0025C19983|nr:AraC family transcriptional regulator [Hyphomicrobium sp.]MCC7254048.1 helix-turn-helix transcriptional regulator [Hyphomicrobium sp.]